MQANERELSALAQLDLIEKQLAYTIHQLDHLPFREAILQLRMKRSQIEGNQLSVQKLREYTEGKLRDLVEKDADLAGRQATAQHAIETSADDYREVQSRSLELEGYVHQRTEIQEQIAKYEDQMEKIAKTELSLTEAHDYVGLQEEEQTKEFQEKGGRLKQKAHDLENRRLAIAGELGEELRSAYDRIYEDGAFIAIGHVKDGACSICKTPIDDARMIALRKEMPVASCPSCKRLLIEQAAE